MEIRVNGECRQFEPPLTIQRLLEALEVRLPHVAVEVNRQLVPRAEHDARQLAAGDDVEVVTLVGGG